MSDERDPIDPEHQPRYQEAMLTFRSVMTASVSTATALFAGSLAILGFGVEGDMSAPPILLSAAPMAAMVALFLGWRWYNTQAATAVQQAIGDDPLAQQLGTRPGWVLIGAPVVAAVALVIFAASVGADDGDEVPSGRCVIESPATGQCSVDAP